MTEIQGWEPVLPGANVGASGQYARPSIDSILLQSRIGPGKPRLANEGHKQEIQKCV